MLGLRKVRYHAAHKLSLVSFSFCFFSFFFCARQSHGMRLALLKANRFSASPSLPRVLAYPINTIASEGHSLLQEPSPALIFYIHPLSVPGTLQLCKVFFFVSGLFFCSFSFRSFVFWCTCAPRLLVSAYFAFVGVAIVRWRRNC